MTNSNGGTIPVPPPINTDEYRKAVYGEVGDSTYETFRRMILDLASEVDRLRRVVPEECRDDLPSS